VTKRGFSVSILEEAALAWLESAGWQVAHGLPLALQELVNAADGASIRSSVQKRCAAAGRAG